MKVLVTFAVEPEFAPFRRLRNFEETRVDNLPMYQAQIGRASVDVVLTGMGPAQAQRAAAAAMSVPHSICICSGFCGALKSEHHVGEILAARAVQRTDSNKTIACSPSLVGEAGVHGARIAETFLSSEKIVATAEQKARLARSGDAVDMESYAVLAVAAERGVSSVAIRVVSDRFDQDLPVEFGALCHATGEVRIAGVLKQIALHPMQLPALIRLGRESKSAAQGLADFLDSYIQKLSFLTHGRPPEDLVDLAAR